MIDRKVKEGMRKRKHEIFFLPLPQLYLHFIYNIGVQGKADERVTFEQFLPMLQVIKHIRVHHTSIEQNYS